MVEIPPQQDRGNANMSWQPEMDELRRRQEMTRRMGGADKVKRQHDGGRLTVRERIERLLDKDSFRELGSIAGKALSSKCLASSAKPSKSMNKLARMTHSAPRCRPNPASPAPVLKGEKKIL